MKPLHQQTRLQQPPQTEATQQQHHRQEGMKKFESVEELLRHDAAQVAPPPAIAQRLKDSLAREPVKPPSWWRRIFSSS